MADEKAETKTKITALGAFRQKLRELGIEAVLTDGLKSTNAKVRAYATKVALKSQEHPFVKKNVLPLIKNEKTKRVLAAIEKRVTRKELGKKLSEIREKLKVVQPKKTETKSEEPKKEEAPA